MLDMMLIVKLSATTGIFAALVLILTGWAWGTSRPTLASLGAVLGVGAGFFVGVWLIGLAPHVPPREDQDRLLIVLLPAIVGVEIAVIFLRDLPWAAWSLRLIVAAGAAPILLYGSIYVSDSAGPGTREWSPMLTALILGGLGMAFALNLTLLDRWARPKAGGAILFTLVIATAGAGLSVMLSGYASGGLLGIPLAAVLAGAAIASFLNGTADLRGTISVGIAVLFAILVVGRFFGNLTTTNAFLLFFAPLLGWLPELLLGNRFGPRSRASASVVLATMPVAFALMLVGEKLAFDSAQPAPTPDATAPSMEDYMKYGK